MKKEKGVEEKEFQKIIRMFKDDKKSIEEMISIRTKLYNILYINRTTRRRNNILT